MERWPREEARWREVLDRPEAVESGFWRREGWEVRIRWTRRVSEEWIARRRRREGSILWPLSASVSPCQKVNSTSKEEEKMVIGRRGTFCQHNLFGCDVYCLAIVC